MKVSPGDGSNPVSISTINSPSRLALPITSSRPLSTPGWVPSEPDTETAHSLLPVVARNRDARVPDSGSQVSAVRHVRRDRSLAMQEPTRQDQLAGLEYAIVKFDGALIPDSDRAIGRRDTHR